MLRMTIVIACVFSACAKPPAHVKATDVVMKKYCNAVSTENQVTVLGFGGFFEAEHIRGFYADFESGIETSKEDAKSLLTGLVSDCLTQLNRDENLKKHLKSSPITQENVSISIGFVGDDRQPFKELSQIHLFENKIFYSTYDREQKTYACMQTEALELENHTAQTPPENSIETESDLEIPAQDTL